MKKDSLRALYQIKSLVDNDGEFKRYMRLAEATRNYQLDRRVLIDIAIDAEALYKINTVSLINMDKFEAYFEEHFRVRREDVK